MSEETSNDETIQPKMAAVPRKSIVETGELSDFIGIWGEKQTALFVNLAFLYILSPLNSSSLFYYTVKDDFWCSNNPRPYNESITDQCKAMDGEKCGEWTFKRERVTIVNEFYLVCDRSWMVSLTLSVYQVGYGFSGIIVGFISDKFGRRTALIFSLCLELLSNLSFIFSTSVNQLIISRFLMGIGGYGRYLSSLLLILEFAGIEVRAGIVVALDIIHSIGCFPSLLMIYYIPNFRYFYAVSFCIELIGLLNLYNVRESPRWLLLNNRLEKAQEVLIEFKRKSIAADDNQLKIKVRKLKENLEQKNNENTQTHESLFTLFKHLSTLRILIQLFILWFGNASVNMSFNYLMVDFSGNIFLNSAIFNVAGLIANCSLYFFINKFNRKTLVVSSLMLIAIGLFIVAPIANKNEYHMVMIMVGFIIQFSTSAMWTLIYVFTPEQFPTSVRHVGVGTCSVAARCAAVLTPFINQLTNIFGLQSTLYILAGVATINATNVFFLYETKGKEIPDTIQDLFDLRRADKEKKNTARNRV